MELMDNKTNYLQWINEHKAEINGYLQNEGYDLSCLKLSQEAYDVLAVNNCANLSEVLYLQVEELICLNGSSYDLANEIRMNSLELLKDLKDPLTVYVDKLNNESLKPAEKVITIDDVKLMLRSEDKRHKYDLYLQNHEILIDRLNLTNRTYNALRRGKVVTLGDAFRYYPDEFYKIRNLGVKSVTEINSKIEENALAYFAGMVDELVHPDINTTSSNDDASSSQSEAIPFDIFDAFALTNYRERVIEYFQNIYLPIESMKLSNRTVNCLKKQGVSCFSEMLPLYPRKIYELKGIGQLSCGELADAFNDTLSRYDNSAMAYVFGDFDKAFDDEYIKHLIMDLYKSYDPFYGISFAEFQQGLSNFASDEKLRRCIGNLIGEGYIEYVDYRCYKVYPSFYTVVDEAEEENNKDVNILKERYSGKTLEEVGKFYGVTRERVRQIVGRVEARVSAFALAKYGSEYVDEDFYRYLYENYAVSETDWINIVGVSAESYVYLKMHFDTGKRSLEEALSDDKVNASLKMKVVNILNKNKIIIDGVQLLCKRDEVEDFIIWKYCRDNTTYEDFCKLYNDVLRKNNIPEEKKIYIDNDVIRTRNNRLADSHKLLWKQWKTFRYYNIEENDYQELLDTIRIAEYSNTGISTLYWINNFPEVMQKYDIRDQYELHNLLRKIIPDGGYNNIRFDKMPIITFGEFDRDQMIYDLMVKNAPISPSGIAEILYEEYGYDKATTVGTSLACVSDFLVAGKYIVEYKSIPKENVNIFLEALSEDFYYDNEMRNIYLSLFPGADAEEINKRSMQEIGFNAYSNYYLRNTWNSALEYFRYLLTKDNKFDCSVYNHRYTYNQMYWKALRTLRSSFDLLTFNGTELVSIDYLTCYDIDKRMIRDFCDNVDLYIDNNSYFTFKSLLNDGFRHPIIAANLDRSFYEDVLIASGYFESTRCAGTVVLYKGDHGKKLTKTDFIISVIAQYSSITVENLTVVLDEEYGIDLNEFYNVMAALDDTNCYYDTSTRTFYRRDLI